MSRYQAEYGYPKADISVFDSNVHLLPPRVDGPTTDDGLPRDTDDYSLKASTILEYPETIQDDDLRAEIEDSDDLSKDQLRRVAEHFAHDLESVPCNYCGSMVWVDEWRGYFARHKCVDCASSCSNCGADLSDTKELVRRERSVRLGNKYKCSECGHSWRGIATG